MTNRLIKSFQVFNITGFNQFVDLLVSPLIISTLLKHNSTD